MNSRKHILMVSIPAYGHMIPLLELAKKISPYHQVTFAVSTFIAKEILARHLIPKHIIIPIVSIPDGYYEAENENLLSIAVFNRILTNSVAGATQLFQAVPFQEDTNVSPNALGIALPVDVVIGDNVLAPAFFVLHERGIPFYLFNTAASGMTLQSLIIDENTPTKEREDETEDIPFVQLPEEGNGEQRIAAVTKRMFLPIHNVMKFAAGIIVNSVCEIEAEVVDVIRSHPIMRDIPFRCVGPLLPPPVLDKNVEMEEQIMNWMNGREKRSVIYVSFGTITLPKTEHIQEIVKALLGLGKPFIWSLPQKEHFRLPEAILSSIPAQFDGDVDATCLIVNWAPQKLILQHPSTAVFISHCGWNSTIEAITTGVPVVAWPLYADQMLNALDLIKKGTGLLIEGTGLESKSDISAESIGEAIEKTAGFGRFKGRNKFREHTEYWRDILITATRLNGSSQRNFQDLIKFNDKP